MKFGAQLGRYGSACFKAVAVMREQIELDEDCSFVAIEILKMRSVMSGLVRERAHPQAEGHLGGAEVSADVEYRDITSEGLLRASSLMGSPRGTEALLETLV
jgi:hypothetical protein